MTKPIIVAGLLGGLLGGVAAFAAGRFLIPAVPAKTDAGAPRDQGSDARPVAEAFVAKLRTAKYDEFVTDVKNGMTFHSEAEFAKFKTEFTENRLVSSKTLGPSLGEFEFVRESAPSPSLSRLIYLEKFDRGGVIWFFTFYRGKDGWRLDGVSWITKLVAAFGGVD